MRMKALTESQLDWFAARIPDPLRSAKGGRPAADKRKTIAGVFWMLDNGAKWAHLPPEFGSKSAVHRWFQRWTKSGVIEAALREAAREVERGGQYQLFETFIDGTFCEAKGGGDGIGKTKAGKGVKIMLLVDAAGLPVAVDTMSATPHESQLVQHLFDFMLTEETPQRIIGDKAYDSDELDQEMAMHNIEMIAPHRKNRRPENVTQDGRPLRRYKRRWTVERTIAWFQNFRRLCIRWEKSTKMFQGYLHFSCALLLLKQVLG